MQKRKLFARVMAITCAVSVAVTGLPQTAATSVQAATVGYYDAASSVMLDSGGYKKYVYGVGTDNWGQSYADRTSKLPPSKVYLTDNYRETVGTVPTSDWASSVVFDQYSESLYAHPLAYRAGSNGMQMAAPAVVDATSYIDQEPQVESLLNDNSVELVLGGEGFTAKDAEVDKTTDWTYDIVMPNAAGTSSIKATIAKGSPYAYYYFNNVQPTISLGAGATNLTIFKNSTSSNIIGVSLTNKTDNKTHYYGIYAPSGTTWTNAGGKLTANLPSGLAYLSMAILPDGSDAAFSLYQDYAFNFITDTRVDWEYAPNDAKLLTTYTVTTKNMQTGAAGGDTIITLYPHQWRYTDTAFTGYTYDTIRGTLKTTVAGSYTTEMTYNGILSSLPVATDAASIGTIKQQLGYLYDYRKNKDDPKWICYLEGQYGGYDTYWVGKNLNTLADAILLSNQLDEGDSAMQGITDGMVEGVENYLEFWFDPFQGYLSGNYVDDYFYYDEDYGTLIGYPASYSSDLELNDHHFHYGYWIKAASVIAMEDPAWAKQWGAMVYEMIGDIANCNRDGSSYNANSSTKYPFLRNFDIYEGHSWASGVANYEFDKDGKLIDSKGGLAGGNNQESSTEAVNAWASLILWGEATGDTTIRDLGVYLYTTEVAAIEDYYYDVHGDVFTDAYTDASNYNIQTVTRLFGGRYDHTAWWTEDPIETTTISMLPITGATLYLGKYKDKVKAVYDSISSSSKQWTHYVANKNQICANYGKADMLTDPKMHQDILSEYYAYYDADAALAKYDMSDSGKVESGESRAHTYAYITSLKEYGMQNFDITGSIPLSLVFEKNGVKTYVAQNLSDETKRVYYSDGAYVDVAAKSSYAGAAGGTETNPNQGDSSQKKFKLEVYLQNAEKTGYDMSSSTLGAKTDADTYTYTPAQINGFTFETGNTGNVLTVSVSGETLETVKVYYTRNTYSISYQLNGATAGSSNPTSYLYGTSIALPEPSKSGYSFVGWYTDAGLTNKITEISSSTFGNLTLYAKWLDESTVTTYTVMHYKQKADKTAYEIVSADTQTISGMIGETVSAQAKSYEGYKLNANSVTQGIVLSNGGLILKLYYDAEGTEEGGSGDTDYEGKGWRVIDDSTLQFYVAGETSGKTILVYYKTAEGEAAAQALYESAVASNGANLPGDFVTWKDSMYLKEYTGLTLTDNTYIIYRFNIEGVGGMLSDFYKISVADLKKSQQAAKKADYTVSYYQQKADLSGYEEVTADKQVLQDTVGKLVVASPKTYTGFSLSTDNAQLKNTGTVSADGSLALSLYYDRNTYTIKYNNVSDATHSNPSTYVFGTAVTLSDASKSGSTFGGWYTDAAFTNKVTEIPANTTGNLVLYAKLTKSETEPQNAAYTINYYKQNAMKTGYMLSNTESVSQKAGAAVSVTPPEITGFTINTAKSVLTGTVASDGTLLLTVYYDRNEEESGDTGETHSGNYWVYTWKQNETKTDYVIARIQKARLEYSGTGVDVYLDSEELQGYTGYTLNKDKSILEGTLTEDGLVLALRYDRNEYKLSYKNTAGATNGNPSSYVYGVQKLLTAPVKTGYTFAGWCTDSKLTQRVSVISTTSAANLTLYAKWTVTPYQILYKLDSGKNSSKNPASYTIENKTITLKAPSRKGYTFDGWYADAKYKTKVASINQGSTGTKTLYAKWSKVTTPAAVLNDVKAAGKGKVAVKNKKLSDVSGYELLYSTDKNFKKSVKKISGTSANQTITKLKAGKTYYVKARAYKEDSTGAKVYGKYSKVKKVKVN